MAEVIFHPGARNDLVEIASFYAEHREAGGRLIRKIQHTCENLARNPYLGHTREEFAPGLPSFTARPYVIFYHPIETGIEVLYIIHGRRDLGAIFSPEADDVE